MEDTNPNLIPPPSIGESKSSRSAQAVPDVKPKRSKLWMVVVACVVMGIGLGVFVYQQSIAPAPVRSPRASSAPKASTAPAASAAVPEISVVSPQSNDITFPKAGRVRVYFAGGPSGTLSGHVIRLKSGTVQKDFTMPASLPSGDLMVIHDTDITVTAGQKVTISSFDLGNMQRPSYGWIVPDSANKCGVKVKADYAPKFAWATTKALGEPIVSKQCWADWSPPNDTSNVDYNDFAVLLSYVPPQSSGSPLASASLSPSTSPTPSRSPSAAPSQSPAASPIASKSPSPSLVASVTPSPASSPIDEEEEQEELDPSESPRVTMPDPDASALPDAGIFEVTAGTMGFALVFILLGVLGLLLI